MNQIKSDSLKEKRTYQRYNINDEYNKSVRAEVKINGVRVHLVDFSLGGVCFLSETTYSQGDIVSLSIEFENRGKILLVGKVAWIGRAKKLWSIGIDLTHLLPKKIKAPK